MKPLTLSNILQATYPIFYKSSHWFLGLIVEIVSVAIYTLVVLVLPDIFEINDISKSLISLPLIPVMLLAGGVTFNPSSVYALWFVHGSENPAGFTSFQVERLIGPILGSILAGVVCTQYFPDDRNSWKKKPEGSNYEIR